MESAMFRIEKGGGILMQGVAKRCYQQLFLVILFYMYCKHLGNVQLVQ